MSYVAPQHITPYPFWNSFTPTLPNLYWDVDSHEERIKKICLEIAKLIAYSDYLQENVNLDHVTIEQLQSDFERFMASGFDDYYAEQIRQWVMVNMPKIITQAVKMVFFGLDDTGRLVAYIPEQWAFVFDTIIDYDSPDYGKLVIKY